MTVIGCVWGAHRKLVEALGAEAPSYEWCEAEWSSRLAKHAPSGGALPAWLYQELFFAWRHPERDSHPHQLDLFDGASFPGRVA